jgi:hypothetical protein
MGRRGGREGYRDNLDVSGKFMGLTFFSPQLEEALRFSAEEKKSRTGNVHLTAGRPTA